MPKEPTRPSTVPKEAVWNSGENEWELGKKDKSGNYVGEWRWWLAPKGHLVCHTFFDDDGEMLEATRYHPNGEVSRVLDQQAGSDIYYRSTEPTSENFAYGNEGAECWKAVKRPGYPISFDYYDKDGTLLNPQIEASEVASEAREFDYAAMRTRIDRAAKSFRAGDLDDRFLETVLKMIGENGSEQPMLEALLSELDENDGDTILYEGDLELEDLTNWDALGLSNLVVEGNLTVRNGLLITEDPPTLLVVTGNLTAANVVTSGGLVVKGNLSVTDCLFGDYNHGSAHIYGDLESRFFHPEEYFFEVGGEAKFEVAFGNSYRLNDNASPELMNFNQRTARDFFAQLDERLLGQIDRSIESYLDTPCEEGYIWEYLDRRSLMRYALTGGKLFSQRQRQSQ